MNVTARLLYDIRHIAEMNPVADGLRIAFRDGTTAFLDAAHPHFTTLRIHADASRGRPVPVGVVLDAGGRVIDLNAAFETAVQSVQEVDGDSDRLKVALWGYGPVCYLTRDHPDFVRLRSVIARAAGTPTLLWVANHSEMVEDEPTADAGEVEVWWKIMDVRPA